MMCVNGCPEEAFEVWNGFSLCGFCVEVANNLRASVTPRKAVEIAFSVNELWDFLESKGFVEWPDGIKESVIAASVKSIWLGEQLAQDFRNKIATA